MGTTFGTGDGSTTFNLPDLRDVTLIGKGNMGGSSRGLISHLVTTNLGGLIGEGRHQLNVSEMPSQAHAAHSGVTDPGHVHLIRFTMERRSWVAVEAPLLRTQQRTRAMASREFRWTPPLIRTAATSHTTTCSPRCA